nr:SCY1-like protein 2 [Lepeophtheirus salmonis]
MFGKSRSGARQLENNPILQFYDVGRIVASGGPELIWKIHEAVSKVDGREASVFVFDKKSVEKLHKPKRKEAVTELLRQGLNQLQCFRHPKLLHLLHGPEENSDTLAFASEPIIGSLTNILSSNANSSFDIDSKGALYSGEHRPSIGSLGSSTNNNNSMGSSTSNNNSSHTTTGTNAVGTSSNSSSSSSVSTIKVDYSFIDVEYRYGLSQITDALSFLHYTCRYIHRNVCPNSIYITKSGTWKLGGLDFIERMSDIDSKEVTCQQWTPRMPKIAQPDLNFVAPEIQHKSQCSIASDMFSLGMTMVAVFHQGNSLIQANHSTNSYFKQAGVLNDQVKNILRKIPVGLQEVVSRLVNVDTRQRPTAQILSLTQYFSDPAVQALQFLDVIGMKDPSQKSQFFRTTLTDVFPFVPRKLWFQHCWPLLEQEIRSQEVLAAVLEPVLFLVKECSPEEYTKIILPSLRPVFCNPKSIQASVTMLEKLPIILEKTSDEDMKELILPLLFNALESKMSQIQMAAVSIVPSVLDYFDDEIIRNDILPKTRIVYEQNGGDVKIVLAVLACISKILDKLERSAIIDEVLPLLWEVKLHDVNVLVRVLEIYRMMLTEKRYGLSVNLIATKVLPILIPQMVNPQLQYDHFMVVHEVLQEMFDVIDRHQRNKLKLDDVPKLPEWQRLRYQHSVSDVSVPNLIIRRPSVVQGPSDLYYRKNSQTGSLASSGSGGSSPENTNYLRVSAAFGQRRLSDNVLTAPGHRRMSGLLGSSASSPGSAPGTPIGFPIRRHSSAAFAANRRYSSNALLSPSTAAQLNRQLGGSMPNCSANSACSSRRSSRGSAVSASYIMMGGGGGYHSGASSRRSSGGGLPGSRRESFNSILNPANMGPGSSYDSPQGQSQTAGSILQSIGSGVVGAASSFYNTTSVTPSRYRKTRLRPQI